jgi:hypothetical protein
MVARITYPFPNLDGGWGWAGGLPSQQLHYRQTLIPKRQTVIKLTTAHEFLSGFKNLQGNPELAQADT